MNRNAAYRVGNTGLEDYGMGKPIDANPFAHILGV